MIYMPSASVVQSGRGKRKWVLKFVSRRGKYQEALMGWVGSFETNSQVSLEFSTLESAESYAKRNGIPYNVIYPQESHMRFKSYADNFK